ncbi:MAG: acyl-CoA dehydrogenase family protein [Burkholderiales bacterium]
MSDEQLALRDAVRRFCEREYPAHLRGAPETRELAKTRWRAMAELGMLGLCFETEHGGSALGAVETMLVAEELGRCLGGEGYIEHAVLAGQLIAATGSMSQRQRLLPALSRGELRIAAALNEAGARGDFACVATHAQVVDGAYRLNGKKTLVLGAEDADFLVVSAGVASPPGAASGIALFLVDAQAPGLVIHGYPMIDGRRAAELHFVDVPVGEDAVLGPLGAALPVIELVVDRAIAALCAQATGVMQALIALCVEHLKTRKQFGVPLASFQVLQNRIADMAIALEQARSMACAAAMAVEAGSSAAESAVSSSERRRMVSAAKFLIGRAACDIGHEAIQLHGAMGMTDECIAARYARRLFVIDQLFGNARHHLQRFASIPKTDTNDVEKHAL